MIFRLGELFGRTCELARGDARRRTIGFVAMDAGAIRGVRKSAFEADTKAV